MNASEDAGRQGGVSAIAAQEENNAPMMAIFGGVFALMLVFLLIVNIFSSEVMRERLDRGFEDGAYRIERMDGGAGYVVIVFPEVLRVVETGESVPASRICEPSSAFRAYAQKIYASEQEQIVFVLLEGSIGTMFEARECLRRMWPERLLTIGWVVADGEFLRSISLDEIPSYIREYSQEQEEQMQRRQQQLQRQRDQ
ncbi:MAG: hypothetical protein ISN28_06030 [Ectothiorhodospiraceae bacterium AqS1]|nr:hypothetical protein [Ectothiorhodospiraceae bacterium AqS1]